MSILQCLILAYHGQLCFPFLLEKMFLDYLCANLRLQNASLDSYRIKLKWNVETAGSCWIAYITNVDFSYFTYLKPRCGKSEVAYFRRIS